MTQSLAGIDPVVGHSDDLSLNLSGRTSMADPFEPVPDPAVAEKFQSAMADGGADVGRTDPLEAPGMKDGVGGTLITHVRSGHHGQLSAGCERIMPEVRKSVGYGDCIVPQNMGEVPIRRSEGASHGHDMLTPEAESIDESSGQIVNVSEYAPRTVSLAQCPTVGAPSAKSVSTELTDVVGDNTRETEACDVAVGRAASPKSPEMKDGIVGTLIFPERSESQVQFNAGSEHVLPENVKPADVFNRVLPEKAVLVERDGGIALQNQEGMPVRRQGDALPYQNIGKVYEMPSDGNEPVQVIAPAPLPIELPASVAQQQSAAAVATHDVVKMFVAAAEAVADAILVSSGFENGEGRILVRLQPEVLGGSEVQIIAKGGTLTVIVNPASQDVQTIVEANRTQFEQHLAEKVHSWRVAVTVRRGEKTNERV